MATPKTLTSTRNRGARLKVAMAAVVFVLTLGFAVGRLTLPREDVARLREMIEPQIRQQLRSEFAELLREEFALTAAATLAASREQTRAWLTDYASLVDSRLERERTERIADCLSLKRDVDTLAINADAGLRRTEHRLAQFTLSSVATSPKSTE